MLDIALSWQQATVTSAGLIGTGALATRLPRRKAAAAAGFVREAGLLTGLYALWQLAGSLSAPAAGSAYDRAAWIWRAERAIGLPSETALQRAFLPHPLLIEFFNLYYAGLHFAVLIACLIWVFTRHRDFYPWVRATVVLFTAGSLLIQLIPVAPPRLLDSDGMVDTGIRFGQSVYGAAAGVHPDQLSAMPSVHVGWALLVALVAVRASRSRWRWLAIAYPAVTTLCVIVTANHFWLDGIAAVLLLGLVLAVERAWQAAWPALGRLLPTLTRRPAPAGGQGMREARQAGSRSGG